MPIPIGIDLGTTNSVVCVNRRGKIELIQVDGKNLLPSTISVRASGDILVGQPAKARAMIDPGNSITSAKRHIGQTSYRRWQNAMGNCWKDIFAR